MSGGVDLFVFFQCLLIVWEQPSNPDRHWRIDSRHPEVVRMAAND
jgi:hypothetical protein